MTLNVEKSSIYISIEGGTSSVIPRDERRTVLKDGLVAQIANYLIEHQGPDSLGSAHPVAKRIPLDILQKAIEQAENHGLPKGLRPYHFAFTRGMYNDPELVKEIVTKKCAQLIATKFSGSLGKFLSEVTAKDLASPLLDQFGQTKLTVSMGRLCQILGGSSFGIVKLYLSAIGEHDAWKDYCPYHGSTITKNSMESEEDIKDLLIKKCTQLINSKFGGDLGKFMQGVTSDDFRTPILETINGHQFRISMNAVDSFYGGSPYKMIEGYLKATGKMDDWKGFSPYHRSMTSMGTYADPEIVTQLLVRKCKQLVDSKFGGDLGGFIAEVKAEDLNSPLVETINGTEFPISMGKVIINTFNNSPYKVIMCYLEAIDKLKDWEGLRPYHLANSPNGTFQDQEIVNELLVKKCDELIEKRYDGNIGKFIANVTGKELKEPLEEQINGHVFKISTSKAFNMLNCSPYVVVKLYLASKGVSADWTNLKPYHMNFAKQGTFHEPAAARELFIKKCNQLLITKFRNKLGRFLAEVTSMDLLSPLVENVNGHEFNISMVQAGVHYGNSPFRIVKDFMLSIGKQFHFTPSCFLGSPESRMRRQRGELTKYDLRVARNDSGEYDLTRFGARTFDAAEKQTIRELLLSESISLLGDIPIKYLGLEGDSFTSLQMIDQEMNLAYEGSVVLESDPIVYKRMLALQKGATNGLRKVLDGIKIERADINDFVSTTNARFNLINLDYVGHLSKGKAEALKTLLDKRVADDTCLLAITLSDSELAQSRASQAGFVQSQYAEVEKTLKESAVLSGWTITSRGWTNYKGGTNGANSSKMLFMVFALYRNNKQI